MQHATPRTHDGLTPFHARRRTARTAKNPSPGRHRVDGPTAVLSPRKHISVGPDSTHGQEGPAGDIENAAAEDAHDHAWPGWRELLLVPRRPEAGTSTKQKSSMARWVDNVGRWINNVGDLYPPGWLAAGGPIRTARGGSGTRHVPNLTGVVGSDLCGDTAGPKRQR